MRIPAGELVIWLVLAMVLAAYVAAAARRPVNRAWSRWRAASFAAGLGLIGMALSAPATGWAHHDLRGHMVQHLLLGMLAPLVLVLAAPGTLALGALPVPAARRVTRLLRGRLVRRLCHPVTALLLDVGALYLLYLTPLFAAAHAHALLGALVHLHFVAAGTLFAWSVAGPDPAPHRPGLRTRLAALFLAIAAHGTLAKVMYAYGWPRGTHHPPEQIRDAAQIMYYGGDFAELLLGVALFAGWYRGQARRRSAPGSTPAAIRA